MYVCAEIVLDVTHLNLRMSSDYFKPNSLLGYFQFFKGGGVEVSQRGIEIHPIPSFKNQIFIMLAQQPS